MCCAVLSQLLGRGRFDVFVCAVQVSGGGCGACVLYDNPAGALCVVRSGGGMLCGCCVSQVCWGGGEGVIWVCFAVQVSGGLVAACCAYSLLTLAHGHHAAVSAPKQTRMLCTVHSNTAAHTSSQPACILTPPLPTRAQEFVSPNVVRRLMKQQKAGKYVAKVNQKAKRRAHEEDNVLPVSEVDEVFKL